ncbi:uncharacterized protein LY79DRAFT_217875 [Colletotrichum navitas]|uniref:Uncharacterized protein n=1 Tax=Colletotrichum navitas TaxID=681940 RepID=A0AAD8PZF3_9PEZI|nr:uncharacterized protein LY79DRAFT_217875 [Colletotrichum navitas]KAK1590423.1 hypothetical protein LY79DRAFT_217875 [Colletotrichum navitas]
MRLYEYVRDCGCLFLISSHFLPAKTNYTVFLLSLSAVFDDEMVTWFLIVRDSWSHTWRSFNGHVISENWDQIIPVTQDELAYLLQAAYSGLAFKYIYLLSKRRHALPQILGSSCNRQKIYIGKLADLYSQRKIITVPPLQAPNCITQSKRHVGRLYKLVGLVALNYGQT